MKSNDDECRGFEVASKNGIKMKVELLDETKGVNFVDIRKWDPKFDFRIGDSAKVRRGVDN